MLIIQAILGAFLVKKISSNLGKKSDEPVIKVN
jgi:hypothetical protein